MLIGSRNFIVVVVLAGISLAVAIALIIAIVVVRSQDRRDGDRSVSSADQKSTSGCVVTGNKYNCRTETIKMLRTKQQTSKETAVDDVTLQVRGGVGYGKANDGGDCGKSSRYGGSQSPLCDCTIDVNGTLTKKSLRGDETMERSRSGQSWPSAVNQDALQVRFSALPRTHSCNVNAQAQTEMVSLSILMFFATPSLYKFASPRDRM